MTTEQFVTERQTGFEQLIADMSLEDMRALRHMLTEAIKAKRTSEPYDTYDNGVNP